MSPSLTALIDRFSISLPASPLPNGLHRALASARTLRDAHLPSGEPPVAALTQLAREINAEATHPGPTYLQRQWLVDFAAGVRALIAAPSPV